MNYVVKSLYGSRLYGLHTNASDTDFRGVFIPKARDLLLSRVIDTVTHSTGSPDSHNTSEDEDYTYYSLRKYVELLCEGNISALDLLHSRGDTLLQTSPIWEYLYEHRAEFYTKKLNGLFVYVRLEATKYGVAGARVATLREVLNVLESIDDSDTYAKTKVRLRDILDKLPVNEFCKFITDERQRIGCQGFYEVLDHKYQTTCSVTSVKASLRDLQSVYAKRISHAIDTTGVDWKALSHALRSGYQVRSIFINKDFTYPLKESQLLLDVKHGKVPFDEVKDHLETLLNEIERLTASSTFPESCDVSRWEDWVFEVYKEHVNKE